MLSQAIGNLLPAAIGVALSPIPIVAVILMLGTPRARSNGSAFAVGWLAGLIAVSIIVVFVVGGAKDPSSATATGVNWFQVVVGVVFFAMAAKQWRKRPTDGEEPEMPTWMSVVDTFEWPKALGLAVLLSAVNPKNLILTAAASMAIAQAGLDGGQSAAAIAVFVVVASSTVVGSVVLYLLAPRAAATKLQTVKDFFARNNAVIMMVLLIILGAKLLGEGFGALGS